MAETIIKRLESANDFLEWASNAPCLWHGELSSRETGYDKTEWTGTKNYEEAYHLARYGWEDGLKMLSKQVEIAESIEQPISILRRRYDVAGHYPSPARAAAGEMFSMVHKGQTFKQKPVVHIRNNFTYSASTSTRKVMNWGAALCSYISHLELTGYPVELEAFFESMSSYGGGPNVSFQFPLKKAGASLSMISLVFWWAHPSALRRIELSADERLDIERWYRDGYGRSGNVTPVAPGTLALSMEDAGDSIKENLEIIRQKHQRVMTAQGKPIFEP